MNGGPIYLNGKMVGAGTTDLGKSKKKTKCFILVVLSPRCL